MPKVIGTKKQRAETLLNRIKAGPSLSSVHGKKITSEDAERNTRLWLSTWIEPELIDLIPELRKKKS